MPKRTDIHSILIIGSGPIVIGQGCEFDYSGVQACRALKEEGFRVVLINSNPATIMTDPEFADATYIEPIGVEAVEKILRREKEQGTPIDALLPTLGGQTGLNTGMACFDQGILTKYGVQMIGADREAIFKGEDRQVFKDLMISIGLKVPLSKVVHTFDEAREALKEVNLPAIIRPAFTLGGTGGGIAYNLDEFETIVRRGLDASPVTEVLIEQSVIGWKEFEMEVVRDRNDNAIIICSIENLDAMGVHTGDSITVAPIQTLTDKEYQRMRDASIAVIRAVGVETGGSNIQFGINPANGEMVVIEMNPRVSRSSALASKATGYPIARIAAKLAVGYTLDELPNPITTRKRSAKAAVASTDQGLASADHGLSSADQGVASADHGLVSADQGLASADHGLVSADHGLASADHGLASADHGLASADQGLTTARQGVVSVPGDAQEESTDAGVAPTGADRDVREDYELYTSACFEPTIDYCVIKIPRFTFEKFPDADPVLTTQMKSVGEAMAIGRTFKEALQKGIRSMEIKRFGFGLDKQDLWLKSSEVRGTGVPPVGEQSSPNHGRDAHATKGESTWPIPDDVLRAKLAVPTSERLWYVRYALKAGWSIDQVHGLTKYDPWFIGQMQELVDFERRLEAIEQTSPKFVDPECSQSEKCSDYANLIVEAKQLGYSDVQMAAIWSDSPSQFRKVRGWFTKPVYKLVDTCAAEFEAATPYYYSTYESPISANGTSATEDEIRLTDKPKVIIIGGGPNRIGQGIEFDYCCVHAAFAMRELGYESVMINSNPETVSTDYDTSDLLFFEPLTHEDILNICERLNGKPFGASVSVIPLLEASLHFKIDQAKLAAIGRAATAAGIGPVAIYGVTAAGLKDSTRPSLFYNLADGKGGYWEAGFASGDPHTALLTSGAGSEWKGDWEAVTRKYAADAIAKHAGLVKGVIVQLGGQTPLNLARGLAEAGVPIIGTSIDSLDRAGDREQFRELLQQLGLKQPRNGIAKTVPDAKRIAAEIGFPVLVRPSFVLGGRAMEIVYDDAHLDRYMREAIDASTLSDTPILIDKFLNDADECDLDCLADYDEQGNGRAIVIGVMEHIEEAGIHSGDSACVLPPYTFSADLIQRLKEQTYQLAKALKVRGLMNVQYAVKDDEIYVIEVNPRASRTVPFVGKATGMPWARIAAKVMAGKSLDELGIHEQPDPHHVSVKEVVFPFSKFPGVDVILGPEMRSTGEVMGLDKTFPLAFAKSQLAAGTKLPTTGNVYLSVAASDREKLLPIARQFARMNFEIVTSSGTGRFLSENDVPNTVINKLSEGRPNIIDRMKNGEVALIVNTPTRKGMGTDEAKIRSAAVMNRVPIFTTLTAASAVAEAIAALQKSDWDVRPLQAYFAK